MKTGLPSIDKPWRKYYTKQELEFQIPKLTIYEYLERQNKAFPNDVALNYFGKIITYDKLFLEIEKTAKALKAQGVQKGDIVTVCMPNTPEYIYTLYAINKIGAISNTIHPDPRPNVFHHYLEKADAKYLIIYENVYEKAMKAVIDTRVEKIIVSSVFDSLPKGLNLTMNAMTMIKGLTNQQSKIDSSNKMILKWKAFIDSGKHYVADTLVPFEENRPAVMVYTGGTTGEPKGVLLSDQNFMAIITQLGNKLNLKRGDSELGITPGFISYSSCNALCMPLSFGITVILIPKFELNKFAKLIKKYEPNYIQANPLYINRMVNDPKLKNVNLSFFKAIASGGDHMSKRVEENSNEFFRTHQADIKVVKGIGLTELTSCYAFSFNESNRLESAGIPLPLNNVKIVDPDTREELTYHQSGEVLVTGPSVMLGYYNNEEATKDSFETDENGVTWFKTRDIQYMDEDGNLYFGNRMRKIILTQGADGVPAKIFPAIIEEIIKRHPKVIECVVTAMPHPERGAVAKAYLTLEVGANQEQVLDDLDYLCKNASIDRYAYPYQYEVLEAFPVTEIGKIDLKKIAQMGENSSYLEKTSDKTFQKVGKIMKKR